MKLRRAYTVIEVTVAITLLTAAAAVAAQVMSAAMVERLRTDERLAALTLAENVLEAARAQPFDRLTPEWAAGLKPDEAMAAPLADLEFKVTVEPLTGRTGVKRVDVHLRWKQTGPDVPVRLSGYFADTAGGGR